MSAELTCLQCGETRASVKANGYICGIMGGGEYNELVEDWPTHRWADWKDSELEAMRIKPEAYEKHRRSTLFELEWAGCDDTVSGHSLATSYADQEWSGARIGQCTLCGHTPETETP